MNLEKKKRLPRNKRVADPPPMRLTERDIEIIKTVCEWRIMKGEHIQQLFFGSQSTASFRLSRLYQHGFLNRHFLPVLGGLASSPTIYTIGKNGVEILKREGLYNEASKRKLPRKQLSSLFLEHTLVINTVRVAVTLSAKRHGYHLRRWLDDLDLKTNYDTVVITDRDGRRREVSIIPDSYFELQVPQGRACFFVEVDRGTETLRRFEEKVRAYESYVSSGRYEKRFGTRSLRILTIAISRKRIESILKMVPLLEKRRLFWFVTFDEAREFDILCSTQWSTANDKKLYSLIN
jgi:hypothetical protein